MQRVVTFGGGTGQPAVLRALKMIPIVQATAVVSMADSGGSSGVLRDERGILPPSDVLRCLLALADERDSRALILAALCRRRFEGQGSLVPNGVGHTAGNVVMAALIEEHGMLGALKCMAELLAIPPCQRVLPSTLMQVTLGAKLENGSYLRGETAIDRPGQEGRSPIQRVWLEPNSATTIADVIFEISQANLLVITPGDLYTSVIPALLPRGITGAIASCRARLVVCVNAMTKHGETDGYPASRHVQVLEDCLGRKADIVIGNTGLPSAEVLAHYAAEGGFPVEMDIPSGVWEGRRVVCGDILQHGELARHNSALLAAALLGIMDPPRTQFPCEDEERA